MAEKMVKLVAKAEVFIPDRGKYGQYYHPGDVFELPEKRAKAAVNLGLAEYVDKPSDKSGQPSK